jgi:hypothetical protein
MHVGVSGVSFGWEKKVWDKNGWRACFGESKGRVGVDRGAKRH